MSNTPKTRWTRAQWLLAAAAAVAAVIAVWSATVFMTAMFTPETWYGDSEAVRYMPVGSFLVATFALFAIRSRWLQASLHVHVEITPGAIRGRVNQLDIWTLWTKDIAHLSVVEGPDGAGLIAVTEKGHDTPRCFATHAPRRVTWEAAKCWPNVAQAYGYSGNERLTTRPFAVSAMRMLVLVLLAGGVSFLLWWLRVPIEGAFINGAFIFAVLSEYAVMPTLIITPRITRRISPAATRVGACACAVLAVVDVFIAVVKGFMV